jgi:hypothetical protein
MMASAYMPLTLGGKAMSQVGIERLDRALQQARADLVEAERLLVADPTDEFAQMSVELFRSEVESFRQILNEEQRFASVLAS